jgi:hypothetical protein
MLTLEQKQQFNDILDELGKSLDITETEYKAAVQSYNAVGSWLSDPSSSLAPYSPEILPQGSFLLGTMIRPIHDEDDLDIDLVCQLNGKNPDWTQYNLKQKVGDRLKDHGTYEKMLDEEGRRCWTLQYNDTRGYHMDILPSIISKGYKEILEKALMAEMSINTDNLAIRITDKELSNYYSEKVPELWLQSNPFGYARWFAERASLDIRKAHVLMEAIKPVPVYSKEKLPLQRAVQILKRHRDMMFEGDCDKPISIIITTLAAKSYKKETNVVEALVNIVDSMGSHIEERYSMEHGKMIKWISNPANTVENFADRWPDNPNKEENFYKWIAAIRAYIHSFTQAQGLHSITESLGKSFGRDTAVMTMNNYGDKALLKRERGSMMMAAVTGTLGSEGRTIVTQHKPFGTNE